MVKKKTKKQVIHLSEFLGDAPVAPVALSQPNWGDTPEEAHDKVDLSSLPSAPRAQREGSFDPSKIPRQPPYTAYVGNLPFDTEDDDVTKMFERNTVKDVRLLKEAETGRFKGYGYVEFESAEGLIAALSINEKVVRGRPIKVDVASQAGQDRGGDRGGNNEKWGSVRGEREPYEDKTSDDWRRDRIVQSDEPPADRGYGQRDRGDRGDRDDRRNNENDTFSRSEFGSKMNDAPKEAYKPRFSGHDDRGPQEKRGDLEWGRGGGDRDDRREKRDGGGFRRDDGPRDESPQRGNRPRLQLAARTKPLPDLPPPVKSTNSGEPERRGEPDRRGTPEGRENRPKPNPFGAAKPADTNAWRSSRAEKQGTGPIRGPSMPSSALGSTEKTDEVVIQDTNKFMLLEDERTD